MSDATSSGGLSRSPEETRRYDLIAGLVLAGCGLILLVSSFMLQSPAPLTVRGSVVIFIAVSIATSFGLVRILSPQDYYGGMALILLSLTAFIASNELPGMRGFAFGPGTAPRLFAFVLAVLSLAVVVMSFVTKGPAVSGYNIRAIIFIIGSILAFAATIRPLGLVIASFACMVICAAATEDIKWRETIIVSAVVTAGCALLFPYGLNLPFQLWPRFW